MWRSADGAKAVPRPAKAGAANVETLGSHHAPRCGHVVSVHSHPRVRLALRMLGVSSARELAAIMAAVGLASNLAALRALVTEGIQRGHMALHARAVSHAAGARGEQADEVRRRLLAAGEVKIDRARELLRALGARS